MTDKEYYQQTNSDVPLFSASYAKLMHEKCPAAVYHVHPKLGGNGSDNKNVLDIGKAFHAYVLDDENAKSQIVEVESDSYRTKDAKALRDQAYLEGKTPLLSKEINAITDMSNAAKNELSNNFEMFFAPHEIEKSIDFNFSGVQARSRLDWISEDEKIIIDVKSTANAHPEACRKAIRNYGYDIQAAIYTRAAKSVYSHENWRVFFIFVEKEEPYLTSVIEVDETVLEVGMAKAEMAAKTWAQCIENDTWPMYGYEVISAQPWEYEKFTGVLL